MGTKGEVVTQLEYSKQEGPDLFFDAIVEFVRHGIDAPVLLIGSGLAAAYATEAAIRDPASRARLVEHLSGPDADFWMADWEDQVICKVNRPENAHLAGRSIGERRRPAEQRACGTGLDAAISIAMKIALGQMDAGIAGGFGDGGSCPAELAAAVALMRAFPTFSWSSAIRFAFTASSAL